MSQGSYKLFLISLAVKNLLISWQYSETDRVKGGRGSIRTASPQSLIAVPPRVSSRTMKTPTARMAETALSYREQCYSISQSSDDCEPMRAVVDEDEYTDLSFKQSIMSPLLRPASMPPFQDDPI